MKLTKSSNANNLFIYFLFFPFPPPDFEDWLAALTPAVSTAALPCVAPPAPFRLLPWPNVDRSLFFNHLSGSGGGVTPGTTPAGTRDIRTFLTTGFAAG